VAALLKRWNTGTVTLTRSATTYTLDARVNGVGAEYIDDETILSTDLMLIVSPKARNGSTVVDLVPSINGDVLRIDGAVRIIKKIEAVPAAGPAARFHIFVAS